MNLRVNAAALATVFALVFPCGSVFAEDETSIDEVIAVEEPEDLPAKDKDAADVDGLFDTSTGDTVAQDSGADLRLKLLEDERVKVSGSFKALGGVAAGYVAWPDLDDLEAGLDRSVGGLARTTISIDARPSSVVRFKGIFAASFTPFSTTFKWSQFTISELFIDYTLGDDVFISLGQRTMSWGQGRLFKPGDLLYGSQGGFSLRASIPSLLEGVSLYTLGSGTVDSYVDLAYAAKADAVFAGTYLGAGMRYSEAEGVRTLVSLKRVAWGTDLLADFVIKYLDDDFSYSGVTGFFREWRDFKLYGEYWGSLSADRVYDHRSGLALGVKDAFESSVDLGFKWTHSLSDGSGVVLSAATWSPWKYVTASIGLPIVYGGPDTYYVNASYVEDDEDGQASGLTGYRLGVVATLTLKFSY